MAERSKILIIGGTGYIGKFVVEASAKSGHPTFALFRESTISDPVKGKIVEGFKKSGVTVLIGDLNDHESLVKAIKQVDVVISTVGHFQLADQVKIIHAIKEAGNVKRFLPSEFGNDVDRTRAVGPAKSAFDTKAQIRRAIEAEGIPYTYVASNYFAGYSLSTLAQPGATAPPRDKVVILGDGNPKAVFNYEHDIATYTIKAADDPRTLNKILYIKPPKNIYSFNDLVSLWEKKIGKTLEKEYVPEEQLLKQIEESPVPINVVLAINHSIFVKGDQTYFKIEPSFGVEASELYPEVEYKTVEEYLDQFVKRPAEKRAVFCSSITQAVGIKIQVKYLGSNNQSKSRTEWGVWGEQYIRLGTGFDKRGKPLIAWAATSRETTISKSTVGDVNGITVGSGTNIQDNSLVHVAKSNISGKVLPTTIGDNVTIGHSAVIHGCTIEDEAFVGMGATLLDGVVVEKHAMVAAGSLVRQDTRVPFGEVWAGNPAKYLRKLTDEEVVFISQSATNYINLAKVHAAENAKPFDEIELEKALRKKYAHRDEEYDLMLGVVRETPPELVLPDSILPNKSQKAVQ
ncbi:isoflavone reductase-like protein [Dorcoceras hygrometricum]|uniref:Isoflavone reductase-like protein n=1 Tax=Dorcoceras hygrometricum TaxID=472368 RepID=A0A2Z7AEX5_9LAMI|nr:isoflavone reductase-like protein [Dorcoceras hygrometricum]